MADRQFKGTPRMLVEAVGMLHGIANGGRCWIAPPVWQRSRPIAKKDPARAGGPASFWEEVVHSLRGKPHVIDIHDMGLMGVVEMEQIAWAPKQRIFSTFTMPMRGAC